MNSVKKSISKTPLFIGHQIRDKINILSHFESAVEKIINELKKIKQITLRIKNKNSKSSETLFKDEFICPICKNLPKKFKNFYSAFIHLVSSHCDCKLNAKIEAENLTIDVSFEAPIINANLKKFKIPFFYHAKASLLDFAVKLQLQKKIKKIFFDQFFLKTAKKINYISDSEEEEKFEKKLTKEEIKLKLKNKVFYHSGNLMKQIGEDSLDEESELELDDKAIRESEEKAINDFEDVDETDKEFFKLWNGYIRDKSPVKKLGENVNMSNLIAFCKKDYKNLLSEFIGKNKIALQKLRYNFVMHLVTLQIYGMINANDFLQLLLELDDKSSVITV